MNSEQNIVKDKSEIIKEMNLLRIKIKELIEIEKMPLSSDEVMELSQRLDTLHLKYQKTFEK